MYYIDITNASNPSVLLFTTLETASGQTAEQLAFLFPWYVISLVRFGPDALSTFGNVILVDGSAHVGVVVFRSALVQTWRVDVGEGLRVYGGLPTRSRGLRGEILEGRAYSANDRWAFRAWRRRLFFAVPIDFAFV